MHKHVSIVGVPMDLGAGRRGVDMGPSAIRVAGLNERLRALGLTVEDLGDLHVPVAESRTSDHPRMHFLSEIVRVCRRLARQVEATLRAGHVPLVLGGDHSIAMGTIGGVARTFSRPGLIWIDAHGDFNTDVTTPSGNIHGMPLAAALGHGSPELLRALNGAPPLDPGAVVLIGIRDLDREERFAVRDSGAMIYSMEDVDKLGMFEVMSRTIDRLKGCDGIHLSLDIDAMDPAEAPGVGTAVRGGLTYRETQLAMEMLAEADILSSVELVEVNPVLDIANRTGITAAELIASVFGKHIL